MIVEKKQTKTMRFTKGVVKDSNNRMNIEKINYIWIQKNMQMIDSHSSRKDYIEHDEQPS